MAERAASFVAERYWRAVTDADLETRNCRVAEPARKVNSKKEEACARP